MIYSLVIDSWSPRILFAQFYSNLIILIGGHLKNIVYNKSIIYIRLLKNGKISVWFIEILILKYLLLLCITVNPIISFLMTKSN